LRSSALTVKSTSETLSLRRSTEVLDTGESSIRVGIFIVTVVAGTGMDPLAVVRSSISGA